MNFETLSCEFGNGKLYFVGKKDVMWHIKEYFDRSAINNRKCNVKKYIDMAIKYNIHMGSVSKKLSDRIFTDFFMVRRRLNKHKLFITFDAYLEAMCFKQEGREKVKRLLNLTDEEIDEIVKISEWNHVY